MIKELQKKFIMTAMIAIGLLLLVMTLIINGANAYFVNKKIDDTLELLAQNQGNYIIMGNRDDVGEIFDFFRPRSEIDVFQSSNFFVVKFDRFGDITYVDVSHFPSVSSEEAIELALDNYTITGKGRSGHYDFAYTNTGFTNETYAIFLDNSDDISAIIRVLFLSIAVDAACLLVMFMIVSLLSKRMIRPIALNIKKQKQFITNAGHELKTPLAIIKANSEALEVFGGSCKYTDNIKSQTDRLSKLMDNLLLLAKMDETSYKLKRSDFDVSKLLKERFSAYKDSFITKKITISDDITQELHYTGDSEMFEKLFDIFFDNALKYAKSFFEVKLYQKDGKLVIDFKNDTSENIPLDTTGLFDRFYRGDTSHNQRGGYGIGLAIAKDIVEMHKGEIKVERPNNNIKFSIVFH